MNKSLQSTGQNAGKLPPRRSTPVVRRLDSLEAGEITDAQSVAAYTLHAAATSAFVTPLCIALFDQRASLPASRLEPRFANLGDELLYFNKGL